MRLLFLAPRHPLPADRGDKLRVLHLVQELARVCEVTLVTFGDGPNLPCDGVRVRSVVPGTASRVAENLRHPNPL
ncbi:MAG: hypothetical protein JWM31_2232, partial [Solirubrobacterales bacterium]|nr:hypothetical protein [Solirubrobacterales bacterium]